MGVGHQDGGAILEAIWREARALLDERSAGIVAERNGIASGDITSLEQLGQRYQITRERVRQIEEAAYRTLRSAALGHLTQLSGRLAQAGGGLLTPDEVVRILEPGRAADAEADPAAHARLRLALRLLDDYQAIARTPWILVRGALAEATVGVLPGLYLILCGLLKHMPGERDAGFRLAVMRRAAQLPTFAQLPPGDIGVVVDALLRMPDQRGAPGMAAGAIDPPARHAPARGVRQAHPPPAPPAPPAMVPDEQPDDYTRWNEAIVAYVTATARPGDPVYLSIDQELADELREQLEQRSGRPVADLVRAVRQRMLIGGEFLIERVVGTDRAGAPLGVAFLATMVMAAAQMGGDDARNIASNDYFTKFNTLFALVPAGNGRPDGLRKYGEEALWISWNDWLCARGLSPSARGGDGPQRYINYPISQALLRGTDRDHLVRIFAERRWAADTDPVTLMALLRRQGALVTVHLGDLLKDASPRAGAIADVIHAVFTAYDDRQPGSRARRRGGFAGLVRSEAPLGGARYAVMPAMPRHGSFAAQQVLVRGVAVALRVGRAGWYQPIGDVSAAELDDGTEYPLVGATRDAIRLPQRNYWICVPDPEAPETGDWGSWGRVTLGEPFLILCRDGIREDLYRLRDEHLIRWSAERPLDDYPGWHEFDGCQIVSNLWDAVTLKDPTLQEALRPQTRMGIVFGGGVRLGGQRWLAGHGPQIRVVAFEDDAELTIHAGDADGPVISAQHVRTNQPIELRWPRAGAYWVRANVLGTITERALEIVHADGLSLTEDVPPLWLELADARLSGAWLVPHDPSDDDAAPGPA